MSAFEIMVSQMMEWKSEANQLAKVPHQGTPEEKILHYLKNNAAPGGVARSVIGKALKLEPREMKSGMAWLYGRKMIFSKGMDAKECNLWVLS